MNVEPLQRGQGGRQWCPGEWRAIPAEGPRVPSGIYGSETESRVRMSQGGWGLTIDGFRGP